MHTKGRRLHYGLDTGLLATNHSVYLCLCTFKPFLLPMTGGLNRQKCVISCQNEYQSSTVSPDLHEHILSYRFTSTQACVFGARKLQNERRCIVTVFVLKQTMHWHKKRHKMFQLYLHLSSCLSSCFSFLLIYVEASIFTRSATLNSSFGCQCWNYRL